MEEYINITLDNIDQEHICCAISDKKHFEGVFNKKEWLKKRITEGHVFRKLNVQGKVFVEYAPLEKAWVPIEGNGFLYIYCLWVSGKFKGHGYGKQLLEYVINDAKKKGKQGVCVISSKKKKSYLADKKFFLKYGFEVVDQIEDYELLSLSFNHQKPSICKNVRIADNSIIGAHAVVTKSFSEKNSVIAGNPAKIVKQGVEWHRERV